MRCRCSSRKLACSCLATAAEEGDEYRVEGVLTHGLISILRMVRSPRLSSHESSVTM